MLKAISALTDKTIGELATQAIKDFVEKYYFKNGAKKSFLDLQPISFPAGNEKLSEDIDKVLYD